jgi:hypothetical protein
VAWYSGTRARGWRAGYGYAKGLPPRFPGRQRCCWAQPRGGQAAAGAGTARADSPGGSWYAHWSTTRQLAAAALPAKGAWSQLPAVAETLGQRLASSTKPAGGRCAARLPPRASGRADTPPSPGGFLLKNALSNANSRLGPPRARFRGSSFPFSNCAGHLNGLSLPEARLAASLPRILAWTGRVLFSRVKDTQAISPLPTLPGGPGGGVVGGSQQFPFQLSKVAHFT